MRALLAVVGILLLTGCSAEPAGEPAPTGSAAALRPEVLGTVPHDRNAFTQGLELADGVLYEGTGLVGRSSVRAVDPATGAVERQVALPGLFGEGITVDGTTIWQLTWQDGVAIRRDLATLAERDRVAYEGEGWGLCHDDAAGRLVMSDGSARLTFRDVDTFAVTGGVDVRGADGEPVAQLNELECVPGPGGATEVWANVWQTDRIVRIDPADGAVTATADLTGLLPAEDRPGTDVLNGIANVPGTDEFLVTGKLWPTMFRVRFVTPGS